MKRISQFKYTIPTFNLIGKDRFFMYNTKTSQTYSHTLTDFIFDPNGTENGHISQQTNGTSNCFMLQKVECILPNIKPPHSRILTFPFSGCTWIFGITSNSISVFRDSQPFQDFRNKTNHFLERFDRLLRLQHFRNAPRVRRLLSNEELGRMQFEEYSVPQANINWPTTAVAYVQFLQGKWHLFIQDTYPVIIQEQPDHMPQLNRSFRYRLIA